MDATGSVAVLAVVRPVGEKIPVGSIIDTMSKLGSARIKEW